MVLRSDKGTMVAEFDKKLAIYAMSMFKGDIETKTFKSGKKNVFIFKEDFTFNVGEVVMYIWNGFYFEL
jgi:hypothetical protein